MILVPSLPKLFDIEKILSSRKMKGKLQHLIKWKNYPEKMATWKNASELVYKNPVTS